LGKQAVTNRKKEGITIIMLQEDLNFIKKPLLRKMQGFITELREWFLIMESRDAIR